MTAAEPAIAPEAVSEYPGEASVPTLWARHLLAFWFPGNACLFLLTGPHPWYLAWLFVIPLVLGHMWDTSGRVERRPPRDDLPAWPFDAVLCLFTVLGYYGDDGDQAVLTRVHGALRPGGQLMLDLSNYAGQLRRLPDGHVQRK